MKSKDYEKFVSTLAYKLLSMVVWRTIKTREKFSGAKRYLKAVKRSKPWYKRLNPFFGPIELEIPAGTIIRDLYSKDKISPANIVGKSKKGFLIEILCTSEILDPKNKNYCLELIQNNIFEMIKIYSDELSSYFEIEDNREFLICGIDEIKTYVHEVIDSIAKKTEVDNYSLIDNLFDELNDSRVLIPNLDKIANIANAIINSTSKYLRTVGGLDGILGFCEKENETRPSSRLFPYNEEWNIIISGGEDSPFVAPNKNKELRKVKDMSTKYVNYIADQKEIPWLLERVLIGSLQIAEILKTNKNSKEGEEK